MAVNTCAALANTTIEVPDNCGKLTKNGLRNNWITVRKILEWIKGFLTFTIPGKPVMWSWILTGETEIDLPFVDPLTGQTYVYPTDNNQYAFFELYWNGQKIEGGYMATGMDPFTYEIQWNGANFDANNYRIEFFDENGSPKEMGTAELPCTISVRFRPNILIGSGFCTTNGSDNPNTDTPCGC